MDSDEYHGRVREVDVMQLRKETVERLSHRCFWRKYRQGMGSLMCLYYNGSPLADISASL